MATNLRLDPATSARLRERAHQLGRSQQSLLREAVDRFLADEDAREEATEAQWREIARIATVCRPKKARRPFVPGPTNDSEWNALIRDGIVEYIPPSTARERIPPFKLPPGVTIQQLIDEEREERLWADEPALSSAPTERLCPAGHAL